MGEQGSTKKIYLSAISAGSAEMTTYPLDFLKTRLQINQSRAVTEPIFTTLTRIIRNEGYRSMYSGVSAAILRHLPYTSIRVSTFESLRNWAQRRETSSQPDIHKADPAIQRAALVNLGELTTYDIAKRKIIASGVGGGKDTLLVHVASSMCSGFVSAAVSTPADVVKTRLMSQDPVNPQFKGMVDCFKKTLQREGVGGLYKGFLPTWARLGPWQLTFWVTFEQLRKLQGMQGF
jgi:hypothetical protein